VSSGCSVTVAPQDGQLGRGGTGGCENSGGGGGGYYGGNAGVLSSFILFKDCNNQFIISLGGGGEDGGGAGGGSSRSFGFSTVYTNGYQTGHGQITIEFYSTLIYQFSCTKTIQNFTVPQGYNYMAVDLRGAAGGNGGTTGTPGYGARVQSYFSVNPGTLLNVFVGCQGATASAAVNGQFNNLALGEGGGYNGGGPGYGVATGGGGATDIRIGGTAYANRIIVAGGGGGMFISDYCGTNQKGGDGGKFGSSSAPVGGSCTVGLTANGGDWNAGGTAGTSVGGTPAATSGGLGMGGKGGNVNSGGGGGGYYGGKEDSFVVLPCSVCLYLNICSFPLQFSFLFPFVHPALL
jgi:hypothetical protein